MFVVNWYYGVYLSVVRSEMTGPLCPPRLSVPQSDTSPNVIDRFRRSLGPLLLTALVIGVGFWVFNHRASSSSAGAPPRTSCTGDGGRPPGRVAAAMSFDVSRRVALLFGGGRGNTLLGDAWIWDGRTWTVRHPATSPTARSGAAIAHDPVSTATVLFGGTDRILRVPGTTYNTDTWLWDGCNWALQKGVIHPALLEASAAYDPVSRSILLFGYTLGGTSQTWRWTGANWNQAHPATSPTGRSGTSMAYDPSGKKIVLFGGFNQNGGFLADTWVWDGSTWAQQQPNSSPAPRQGATLGASPYGGHLLLFGGIDAAGQPFHDTWLWTGSTWVRPPVTMAPTARSGA